MAIEKKHSSIDALFLRGKEAADGGNYDYAITIFRDVLRADPTHRTARIALRGCEMEKFREAGSTAKLAAFFKGFGSLLMMNFSRKPDRVVEYCERYLVNDPTNISVLRTLATAYGKLAQHEAATDTLEFARQRSPDDLKLLRQLAEALRELGQYDKAVRCLQEIIAAKPDARDAAERMRQISAESHLKRSRMEDSQNFRDGLRDEAKAQELMREERMVRSDEDRSDEIGQLKAAAEAKPEDADAWMRLGDACFRAERFTEAELAYRKSFELSKKYPAREKMGNARLRNLEQAENALLAHAKEGGGDPALMGRAHDASRKRQEFAIKEYEFRRKQHPTDMKLAFTLGMLYLDYGGPDSAQKAIQQFQSAMTNASLKLRAQMMLGRCFAMDPKTLDMAKEQFAKALESIEDNVGDMAKGIMYELGSVCEKLSQRDEALTWYKKIFSVDAGFRDVARKIQELG